MRLAMGHCLFIMRVVTFTHFKHYVSFHFSHTAAVHSVGVDINLWPSVHTFCYIWILQRCVYNHSEIMKSWKYFKRRNKLETMLLAEMTLASETWENSCECVTKMWKYRCSVSTVNKWWLWLLRNTFPTTVNNKMADPHICEVCHTTITESWYEVCKCGDSEKLWGYAW